MKYTLISEVHVQLINYFSARILLVNDKFRPKFAPLKGLFKEIEPKVQVSFSDENLSVVRRLCCRRKLFPFFFFFSRTTGPISTKLGIKYSWVKGDSS